MTTSRTVRPILCMASLAATLSAGGCWSSMPASSPPAAAAGFSLPADAWPPRDAARLDALVKATPDRFSNLPNRIWIDGEPHLKDINPLDHFSVTHAAIHGQGLLRVIAANGFTLEVEGGGPFTADAQIKLVNVKRDEIMRFVSFSTLPNRPVTSIELIGNGSGAFISALRTVRRDLSNLPISDATIAGPRVLNEGLAARLIEPPKGVPARGLIVHLGGIGSARFEVPLVERLARQGWNVLSVPFVGVIGGYTTSFVLKEHGQIPSSLAEVSTGSSTLSYVDPLNSSGLALSLSTVIEAFDTPEALGERIARITDDRIAEPAYLVEAALEYLDAARPDLARKPTVLLGCSAGALVAPAVAARLPGRFDAAVLVGAGENLLDLGIRTAFTDVKPEIRWDSTSDDEPQKAKAVAAYAKTTQLDPMRTAPALLGMPILMLHGRFDRIVPADSGLSLWNRLGRPERWNFLGGHEGMFLTLPDQAGDISDWLVRTLPGKPKE